MVELGEMRLEEDGMESGLKQGCTLSPILFALYVMDLGGGVNEKWGRN